MTTKTRMGRPPEPIPADATKCRPYFYLSPDVLARLEDKAKAERRTVAAEVARALEAYLRLKELPDPPDVDPSPGYTRFQIDAAPVRELDNRVGADRRDAHLVEAVTRWVAR